MSVTTCSRGYTLIEVLTCAAIVAFLSAVALPAYHRTVLKGHRAVARATLTDLAARQEDVHRAQRAFATSVGALIGSPGASPEPGVRYLGPGGNWEDQPATDSRYRVEVLVGPAPSAAGACGPASADSPLAVSALAIGPQERDRTCRRLVLCFAGRPGAKAALDDQGRATPATRDECWGLRSG